MRWLCVALAIGCTEAPVLEDAGVERPPEEIGPSERPARFFSPGAHDGTTALPLVVLLHGYSVNAMLQDAYFALTRHARSEGFYLILPDGTRDSDGQPHWDVIGAAVDDHAYLRGLIEEASALVPVRSVYLIGHSNGGFMAYRLACDSSDLVDAIASLAGSDALGCASSDVAILQIHGTADGTIAYEGGTIAGLTYPGAQAVVDDWAARLGCTGSHDGEALDLVSSIDGAETRTLEHDGCRGAALWSMEGADHIPPLTAEFTPSVLGWLFTR